MNTHITLILLTVLGALFVAVLGWIESGEPFDFRKFAASIGRAILGGFLAALIFRDIENPDIWIYLVALLTGAGVDVAGHRLSGAINQLTNNEDYGYGPVIIRDVNE
ncbi:MAG TPA: hypothetical protein VMW50_03030 [Dehalococcoidia bacterium]|nr:hypothetical protein [Dehalococcoidia bacterium]